MPDWWPVIQAARYLGVAPWELARQPVFWLNAALLAQGAEAEAAAYEARRATRRAQR
ncbi:MAG: hypothetical protein N2439_04490 [Anaerolineae bacterium]|nr:hypothetical protein [Anaerolineae bacterium]